METWPLWILYWRSIGRHLGGATGEYRELIFPGEELVLGFEMYRLERLAVVLYW